MSKLSLQEILQQTALANALAGNIEDPIQSEANKLNADLGFMSVQLYSEDGSLSEGTRAALDLARKLAVLKKERRVVSEIEKAIAFTRAIHLIKFMGDFSELKSKVIYAALVYSQSWKSTKHTESRELTMSRQLYKSLLRVTSKDSIEAKLFLESYDWLHVNYTLDATDMSKTYIPEPKSDIKIGIARTGISITVDAGVEIKPTNGNSFVFKRKMMGIFGVEVFNKHLSDVLRSIKIHNEFLIKSSSKVEKDILQFRKDPLSFRRGDVLGLLLLLKQSNISTKELFNSFAKGKKLGLALVRKLDGGHLERIYVPSYNFPEVYENTGVVSLSQSRQGYFTPVVTIPRLAEFNTKDGTVTFREDVNKTLSRIDKMENKDGTVTKPTKILVIVDATVSPKINRALLSGAIFMPSEWLEKWGCCRIITDMAHGGLKASTTSIRELDPLLDAVGAGIVGPSSFKGGMLSALALASSNPEIVKNLTYLEASHSECAAVKQQIQYLLNNELKEYIIDGAKVKGFVVDLELTITNAYTAESVIVNPDCEEEFEDFLSNPDLLKNLDNLQNELENGERSVNGLRDMLLERAVNEDDFKITQFIREGLEDESLKYKAAVTRIIAPELQSLVYWYSKGIANEYLSALLKQQAKGMDVNKILAAQWITGEINLRNVVSAQSIADKLIEGISKYKAALTDKSAMYVSEMIQEIYEEHFKTDLTSAWVGIEYPNGDVVPMPIGNIFSATLEEDLEANRRSVLVKGLFADLMENIKGSISNGVYNPTEASSALLKAAIQKPLLGKYFGYQYTRGMYGVMLPLLDTDKINRIALTKRDRIFKSVNDYVLMNGSKAPQLFYQATAGFKVYKKEFRNELLNIAFACAIFITPEATLILQNDHDGDLFRLTYDGYALPKFKGPFEEFNSKFFTDAFVKELTGNRLKIGSSHMVQMREFHTELFNAVEAKRKVGLYTANKYFYEVAFENVENFVGHDGGEYTLSHQDKYFITAILAQLVQDEAMNNIKQNGSNVAFTELTLAHTIDRIKDYGTKSAAELTEARLTQIKDGIVTLNDRFEMGLTETRIHRFAHAIWFAAKNFKKTNMLAFALMNKRCIEETNVADILNAVSNPDAYEGTYDFYGQYDAVINCADNNSMYHNIVKFTVETVFGTDYQG